MVPKPLISGPDAPFTTSYIIWSSTFVIFRSPGRRCPKSVSHDKPKAPKNKGVKQFRLSVSIFAFDESLMRANPTENRIISREILAVWCDRPAMDGGSLELQCSLTHSQHTQYCIFVQEHIDLLHLTSHLEEKILHWFCSKN